MALVVAAQHNHLEVLQFLIDQGGRPQAQKDKLMHHAVINNNLRMVKFLFSLGFAPSKEAFNITASQGHLHILKYFLRQEVRYSVCGWTLMRVINYNHLRVLRYLVNRRLVFWDTDHQPGTFIRKIACDKLLPMIKYLCSIKQMSRDDLYNGIISAADHNQVKVLRFLVKYTANPKAGIEGRYNRRDILNAALRGAATQGHFKALKYLVGLGQTQTYALRHRICRGIILRLIQVWDQYYTPLSDYNDIHYALDAAICRGHLKIVKYLVNHQQASPMYNNDQGVAQAASHGHLVVLKYLLAQGCQPWAQSNRALREAFAQNQYRVVRFLVKQRCSLKVLGYQALQEAVRKGHLRLVKLMIMQRIYDIKIDLLTEAANHNQLQVFRFLFRSGSSCSRSSQDTAPRPREVIQEIYEQALVNRDLKMVRFLCYQGYTSIVPNNLGSINTGRVQRSRYLLAWALTADINIAPGYPRKMLSLSYS
jgi:ankyrin repeat protein